MRKKPQGLVMLGILLVALIAAGCHNEVEPPLVNTVIGDTAAPVETTPGEQDLQTPDAHVEDIVTKTPYGELYFPGQWAEYTQIDQVSGSGFVEVIYSAQFNVRNIPLFSIIIGEGEGVQAGTITAEDGTQRNVYVKFEELEEDESLGKIEQNRLYAMQEDLNYLLDNLK